jgi:hypothetical protein
MTLSLYAMSRSPFSLVIWGRHARCAADQYNHPDLKARNLREIGASRYAERLARKPAEAELFP